MSSKTISLRQETYALLRKEKQKAETFSDVIERLAETRPMTAGEIEEAMKPFLGIGAAGKRKRSKHVVA